MRVSMGEVIDVNSELTTKNLTLKQKISLIWESMISDSKILGNKKKFEAEKALKEYNEKVENLRDGLLASVSYHLQENRTLDSLNEEAEILQLSIERTYSGVIDEVLGSAEFNQYEFSIIHLDNDLVNSFGDSVPIILSFKQKKVF